ncbi:MAG: hypothetical protein HQ525_04070 [Anaerolineae bacterium]|nr:hypothetical protein [Anaerolineae bacterium]
MTGTQIELSKDYDLNWQSFADFMLDYKAELKCLIFRSAKVIDKMSRDFHKFRPNPYASFIMKNCHKNGRDLTDKGVKYNFLSMNGIGLANAADSLIAIKQLIFQEKKCSFNELADMLNHNFQNNEQLRQYMINRIPKFGNDNDSVDRIAREVADFFCLEVMKHRNSKDDFFQAGLHSVRAHGTLGERTNALPDGRLKGVSLANSLSPAQGRDLTGPTAVVNSLTKLDHALIGNGMVLDMKFHPDILKHDGTAKLEDLIKTYFKQGGMEVQFNIIDEQTLRKAQARPDLYAGLIVRVSGFSAHFTQISKVLQDEIIARTEYRF